MIKDTFYNLEETKKERIIEALYDEFSEYSYDKASITRICERADIAKGSFYQYFDEKKDAFFVLIDHSAKIKMEYLEKAMKQMNELGFFGTYREMTVQTIKMLKKYPKMYKVGKNMLGAHDVLQEIIQRYGHMSMDIFNRLIDVGYERNELNKKIDRNFLLMYIVNLQNTAGDYMHAYLQGREIKTPDDYLPFFEQFFEIIENGMSSHE